MTVMSREPAAVAGQAARQQVDAGVAELVGDPDRPRAWTLLVDGTPQSHVDLDDPRHLEFEYVRRLGHLIDVAAAGGAPLRVLHLGGGGLTLARYVTATRPGSVQVAVDSDAALVEFVRRELPLDQRSRRGRGSGGGRIRVRIGDARAELDKVAPASFDLVVADLFVGAHTPAHLTSAEFAAAASRALTPGGSYAVNIADGPPLAHARARVAGVMTVFEHVCLIAEAPVLRGRRFGNLVAVGSRASLPVAELTRRAAGDPFPARVIDGSDLDRFVAGTRPLTDASARPSPLPPPGTFGRPLWQHVPMADHQAPDYEVRQARAEDAHQMARLFAAVAAERDGIATEPPVDVAAVAVRFVRDADHAIVAVGRESIVGLLNLHVSRHGFADIGMLVDGEWRGCGVGAALMDAAVVKARELGLHKLSLDVFPHNAAAIALYRRSGFVEEGRRVSQYRRSSGELWDSVMMGLLLEPAEPR
jgi:spermidine synthase/RimJ/RimL family protein N-acetyltransferase